jgi:hypothetical protein
LGTLATTSIGVIFLVTSEISPETTSVPSKTACTPTAKPAMAHVVMAAPKEKEPPQPQQLRQGQAPTPAGMQLPQSPILN